MRALPRIAALAALILSLAGCSGYPDRRLILNELNPAPMSNRAFAQIAGTYTGPIQSSSLRGGFEGESAMDTRLDLSGSPDAPEVILRIDSGFSTAWAMYGERKGVYTNIPSKRYGSQGVVSASTHAPRQLLLRLTRFGAAIGTGDWIILTFNGNSVANVDFIGHSGWRGDGELSRVPSLMQAQ